MNKMIKSSFKIYIIYINKLSGWSYCCYYYCHVILTPHAPTHYFLRPKQDAVARAASRKRRAARAVSCGTDSVGGQATNAASRDRERKLTRSTAETAWTTARNAGGTTTCEAGFSESPIYHPKYARNNILLDESKLCECRRSDLFGYSSQFIIQIA